MPAKKYRPVKLVIAIALVSLRGAATHGQEAETLTPPGSGSAPQNFEQLWADFDPRAEPLETEVLKEWQEDNVVLRVVRFRIGIFKGTKAILAAVYGFPKEAAASGEKLPGLLQIHGGGQYADHKACLTNAKRGYATVSIAWAGRISAPDYRVSPAEVKLFWDDRTDDPGYRLTTDWGAVDGYHAPGRNAGNHFPDIQPASWTLDSVASPRNSGWFLCAVAARRALTFLEQQPEVDPDRLGVYGHSMGGKLTVMTATDSRVKVAAPSCGGISDLHNKSRLFRATLGDDVSLKQISCPIMFLSPANDFHGRIGDLPAAIRQIHSRQWRVTCSPHHNHQDTPPYEVATQLWLDQHLKRSFSVPQTPETELRLNTGNGIPVFTVRPDTSKSVLSVDVFYTLQGRADGLPEQHEDTMHRFWHHAAATNAAGVWTASVPLSSTDKPLWVYANVRYQLDEPVSGAGYYYGLYTADSFNLSSLLTVATAQELTDAGVRPASEPSLLIEDFQGDWKKEWFTYRPAEWAITTHKPNDAIWKAPPGAGLSLSVRAAEPNTLVLLLDQHATEVQLSGSGEWQEIHLQPEDFRNYDDEPLADWSSIRRLKLSPVEHLRPGRGKDGPRRRIGAAWKGSPPAFRNLRWQAIQSPPDVSSHTEQQMFGPVWTKDDRQTGVRWLPCISRPLAGEADRPNILFIFADDWGWGDLSCHGHPYVKTPNIDRLAREGTDFHRFTVASGVCSPSRTAVMTGHFPARYNIDGHFAWVPSNAKRNMPDWLSPDVPLLPAILRRSGYATAHFGKWHLSNNMIPDSPLPSEYGYDEYGAFNCAGEQMPVHEDADNAIAFIEESHRAKKPFFINLWIHEPHTPFHTVPKYRWRFRELREPDNIYASVLSHADERIGEVLDALDRLKLTDNTLVVFSSDNGPARATGPTELKLMHDTATGAGYGIGASRGITGGRKGYKSALFEGGIGVPFIARWPGKIPAGKVDSTSLISAVDLLPTFCDLAGAGLPADYSPDGISQVDALLGTPVSARNKPLFWKMQSAWPIPGSRPYHWVSWAIVHENWKLLTNRDATYAELYDIAADPYEKTDLADTRTDVVKKLQQQISQWKATLPDAPSGDVFSAERKQPSPSQHR